MAETWAKYEYEFLTSDALLKYPVGARWLYCSLWGFAHNQRRQTIRRPSNTWLADHFGLRRHPIGDYLQALDDDGLIILTDSTIELPGLKDKHGRYKYKDEPISERRPYAGDKPKAKDKSKKTKVDKADEPKKEPVAKKKKASKDAKHEATGTRAKRLVDYFFEEYKKKRGARYRVVGQRDMNIFKTILQADDEHTIKRAIDKFLSLNGDAFLRENGYSIPAFKSRYQGLVEGLDRESKRAPITGARERVKGTE